MEVTTADIGNQEVTNVETSRMEESVRNAKQTLVTLREELELMKQTHLEQVEKLTNQMDSPSTPLKKGKKTALTRDQSKLLTQLGKVQLDAKRAEDGKILQIEQQEYT